METKALAKFKFDGLPPIKLKGKEQLVPIFRPLQAGNLKETEDEAKAKTSRKGVQENRVIVGRAPAQNILQQNVDSLFQGGSGGITLIMGHAGIGKSVLLKDVARMAAAKPIKTFFGAGDSLEISTPYYVWRNIFMEALELQSLTDKEQRRLRVELIASEDAGMNTYLPCLNAVIPLDIPENEETASMSKLVRGNATQKLLLILLQSFVSRG